jgi:hypothetical protein
LPTPSQRDALRRLAEAVAGSGGARFSALRDILFQEPPRLRLPIVGKR